MGPEVYMKARDRAILCLCYDRNMLQVRQMLLEHFGFTVLPTSSVEEAEQIAGSRCPDMLLMDNSYPGIDFQEIAKQVKRACPGVITVLLSPYYYGFRRGSDGAIDHFVTQDDSPDQLISQLQGLLGAESGQDGTPARPI